MKYYSQFSIIFLTSISLITFKAHSQDYLVSTKGDTIVGKIKPQIFGAEKKVTVTDSNKKKTTLSLFQTRVYSLKGELYAPVRSDKGYTFMKLLKPGYLSLYAFQIENQSTYDGQFLVKKDGQGVEVPNLSFKKVMTKFLSDCPEIADQIESGVLGKKNVNEIIDLYNTYIDNKSKSQQKSIELRKEKLKGLAAWDVLEEKVKAQDFDSKSNALEMIGEIKNKVKNAEKIPNFLSEGLKNALQNTPLKEEVESLLSSN